MRFPQWVSLICATCVASQALASENVTYTYDSRGRLIRVDRIGTVNNGINATYSFDKADNRTNVTVATTPVTCLGVSFTISTAAPVTEGASSVFTVTKTGTATGSCTVDYATANGTATAGSDYTAAAATLTFTSAQTSQPVNIATTDDATVENAETYTISLATPTGGATLGTPNGATATINDNENHPPTPVNDTGTQQKCRVMTYNVTANDTDPESNYPLVVTAVTGSGFAVASSTSVQFTSGSATGNMVGTYTVRDSLNATATATLTVNVSGGSCV